jgi:ABC-2 type transport system permease protein
MTDITLDRPAPVLGGFTPAYLRLELVRKLRNPRGLFFTVAFPVLMFFIVGYQMLDVPLTRTPVAAGGVSAAAYIMVSMAMYGAMMSATQTGASVAVERSQGWTRQLRLTPLHPVVNVAVKTIAGMVFGLVAVAATFAVAAVCGVQLSGAQWIVSGVAAWLLAGAVFTTLGLMVGYMVPGENVAQITSLVVVLLAFLGGLFYPLSNMPDFLQTIGRLTPVYGIGELARGPLTGDGFDLGALVNAVVWLAVFVSGTVIFFRRDTRRS